jgi:hypothetical protein
MINSDWGMNILRNRKEESDRSISAELMDMPRDLQGIVFDVDCLMVILYCALCISCWI